MPPESDFERRILLLPPTKRDADAIRTILEGVSILCVVCGSMEQLCEEMRRGAGGVLVSEEALSAEPERYLMIIAQQPVWSDLPTVVLSRSGMESPKLEQLLKASGNVTVLERPVRISTLLSVVRSALRGRGKQVQVREHLANLSRTTSELRESEERYRLLIENVRDYAIFVTDAEGTITDWNRGAELILGYRDEDVIGRHAGMLFTKADQKAGVFRGLLKQARETGRATDARWHCRKNGEAIYIEGVTTAIRDGAGRLIGFSKLMRDVTARKEAEEALRRNRDAFFNLVDRAPFGVYVIDSAFQIHSVNAGAQGVFENVRPLIGRDFEEAMRVIWPEEFVAEVLPHFRRTLATGEAYAGPSVTETRRDVGIVQSYEWELHRVELPDGQHGVVCYFYDSTHMKRTEAALREAKRKSEAALLAGEVGTYYWDIKADLMSGDTNFYTIFGVVPTSASGLPISEFVRAIHKEDRARVEAQVKRTLETLELYRAEYRIARPDGERWVLVRGVVETDGNGTPAGWAGVVLDITERKRAEEARRELLESERAARAEAERASRMKEEFLATLSHELRTPLNAILGWTHLLTLEDRTEEDLAKGIQTIERNARAQSQIIADLLDMSRVINGKVRLDVQRVSVAPIVQAAVDTVMPAAQARGVKLRMVLDPRAGPVSGDPNRLQQVFWNLLSNAVKFTARNQRVDVILQRVNSHIEVSVIDTGEGIAPEFLPHVFDRFRQADGSTTRRHGGLGLGLAIVKQLVELHGGTVRAKSDGLGKGATFSVLLPVSALHAEPALEEEWRHPTAAAARPDVKQGDEDIAGLRVLVVDDEPDSRELIRKLLEGRRAWAVTASSAQEALELLQKERPDVLVSDIGMPGEDGYSLIRRVRELRAEDGGRTPAVALTAYARADDRVKAVRAGFQHHIAKPVEPAELIAILASLGGGGC